MNVFMISIGNHLGTITISKKYLISLATAQAESSFGIAGLNSVKVTLDGDSVSVKISAVFSPDVNIPAVADAVSHKTAYELINKTGVKVSKVEIFADSIV